MKRTSLLRLAGAIGGLAALTGCVVAPPAYQGYDAYGQPVYVQPAPAVVPAPAITIGVDGYYRGGGYRGGGYYRGGPGYWRRGYWR